MSKFYLAADEKYLSDYIDFSISDDTVIPVVTLSTGSSRASMYPGVYREPRIRTYSDKLSQPTLWNTPKEITFSVLMYGNTMDYIYSKFSRIQSYLDRAEAFSSPFSRGTGVVFIEQLNDATELTMWDVVSGVLTDVDMNLPGENLVGAILQLVVSPYSRGNPKTLAYGSTLVNGTAGKLYVPNVHGDAHGILEFRLKDVSTGGNFITWVGVGRRWYPKMASTDWTPSYSENASITTSSVWQSILTQSSDAGKHQTGLFDVWAMVNDASPIIGQPQMLAPAVSANTGFLGNGIYSGVVAAKDSFGNLSNVSNLVNAQVQNGTQSGVGVGVTTIFMYDDLESGQLLNWIPGNVNNYSSANANATFGLTSSGPPSSGTFTLTVTVTNGSPQTTAGIAYNAPATGAGSVQSALAALSNVGTGNVACTGGPLPGSGITTTFQAALAATYITVTISSSTGGGSILFAGGTVLGAGSAHVALPSAGSAYAGNYGLNLQASGSGISNSISTKMVKTIGALTATKIISWQQRIRINSQSTTVETHSSSSTWTAPAGVTSVQVETWGAGGGGGSSSSTANGAGGGAGGGGAYQVATVAVTPASVYNYVVGAAGAQSVGASGNGGTGGSTSFNGGTIAVGGSGGGGGTGSTTYGVGGAGGTGVLNGGNGGNALVGGGGGGGGAGSTGNGANGGTGGAGGGAGLFGAGGTGGGGNGGNGGSDQVAPPTAGSAPGGGGGGGSTLSGGGFGVGNLGGGGQIRLTYNAAQQPTYPSGAQLRSGVQLSTATGSPPEYYFGLGSSDGSNWGAYYSNLSSDLTGQIIFGTVLEGSLHVLSSGWHLIETTVDMSGAGAIGMRLVVDGVSWGGTNVQYAGSSIPAISCFLQAAVYSTLQTSESLDFDNIGLADGYIGGVGISGGSEITWNWDAGINASDYILYLQMNGAIPWYSIDVGNVTTYTWNNVISPNTTLVTAPPNTGSVIAPAQIRTKLGAGSAPVRFTPSGNIVRPLLAGGVDEMVRLGTLMLPPGSKGEYRDLDGWTLEIDGKSGASNTSTLTIKGLWLFPADEDGPSGVVAKAPGLSQLCEWRIGWNRFGRPYCLLFSSGGTFLGYADVSGGLSIRPGDNQFVVMVQKDNSTTGTFLADKTNLKFQLGAEYTERSHFQITEIPII